MTTKPDDDNDLFLADRILVKRIRESEVQVASVGACVITPAGWTAPR